MKRKEMLARLKKGEDPLELSIEKWQDIVDGKGEDLQYANCALCEADEQALAKTNDEKECEGCIVCKKTGSPNCWATPYLDYYMNPTKSNAKKEVKFLKSLRKEAKE